MAIIDGDSISHIYAGNVKPSLYNLSFSMERGEFVAIVGANGSGKSTLAKHLNALISLQRGSLTISGLDVKDENNIDDIRRICGMVFQNPDNQFVSSVVEEDIAFGLENYNTPYEEIPDKVSEALKTVGMAGYEKKSPHMLSGGQKQRIALAGVLAVSPEIIIFDESTAMLDPEGRTEILKMIETLNQKHKKSIILITHYIEETVKADRIFVMYDGKILKAGKPGEILCDKELLAKAGLIPPLPVRLYYDLSDAGITLPFCPLTDKELCEAICQLNS